MKPSPRDLIRLLLIPTLICGMLLILFPALILPPGQSQAAGLALITISLFASGGLPEYLTALLFFLLAMLFKIAAPEVIFSGFQSTALWLVFGGLILGVAIRQTGLGQLIAERLSRRLNRSYALLILGMGLVGFGFAIIMPSSMGRIILLTPIALALADHFGFKEGSNGRTAIVLSTVFSSFIPAFSILPANVPNMVLSGLAETQFHEKILFGEYLLLHFPILGLLKLAIISSTILRLYPDRLPTVPENQSAAGQSRLTSKQRILAVTLIVLVALWASDFIHHISPAWVALGGAIFLLLPKVGIVEGKSFNTQINYASLFFIAGILGLGSLIAASGLGNTLGRALIAALPLDSGSPFVNFLSLIFASSTVGLFTTLPGIPAVMTPLAEEIAQATGFSIKAVLMMQVISFSTVLLPYQAPPIVVAMQLSGERMARVVRPLIIIVLATLLVLLPLDYFWWKFLGWI